MASKQTLKSLLKGSNSRVQADLNLDQVSFSPPRISGGDYRVQVQDTPRTNTAGLIANALGEFAGPVLNQYKSLEKQKQEEYAEIAKILTPEQAEAVSKGDVTSVQASLDATADKLNGLQRKQLLKFVDNPNNYRLAANVIGTKVAGQYGLDLMGNLEAYSRSELSPEEQFAEVRKQLIETNSLQGHALVGFLSEAARQEAQYAPRIIALQNEKTERNFITNSMDVLNQNIKGADYEKFSSNFNSFFNGYPVADQTKMLTSLFEEVVATGNLDAAEDLTGWLVNSTAGIKLGKDANLSDGVINSLNETILNARTLNDDKERRILMKERSDMSDAMLSAIGFSGQTDAPETLSINIGGVPTKVAIGETVTETMGNFRASVSASGLSKTEQGFHFNEISKFTNIAQQRNTSRINATGAPQLVSSYMDKLNVQVNGENVYGYSNEFITNQVEGFEDTLKTGIAAIYADNETYKTDNEKQYAADRFVKTNSLELQTRLNLESAEYNKSVRTEKALTSVGMGMGGNYFTQVTTAISFLADADGGQEALDSLRSSTITGVQDNIRSIVGAPFTDEEKLDIAKAVGDRNRAVSVVVQDSLINLEKEADAKYNEIIKVKKVENVKEGTKASKPPRVPNPDLAQWTARPENEFVEGTYIRTAAGQLYEKHKREMNDLDRNEDAILDRAQWGPSYKENRGNQQTLYTPAQLRSGLLQAETMFEKVVKYNILVKGEMGITLDELRSGNVQNHWQLNSSLLNAESANILPVLSLAQIHNPNSDTNRAIIEEFAVILGVDPKDENELSKIITRQAGLFTNLYGIRPTL
jgi:hypothetical protein